MNDHGSDKRALRCEEARVLLMGYIDGELDPAEVARVEDHLAVCVSCRREERSYRSLGDLTEAGLEGGDIEVSTEAAWESIYGRLERRVGWVLTWIGILVLSGYGLWHFVDDFLLDPEAPLVVRVGVGALGAGALTLLISFLRETLWKHRNERYREVQR